MTKMTLGRVRLSHSLAVRTDHIGNRSF
jgi:hypothetical protein